MLTIYELDSQKKSLLEIIMKHEKTFENVNQLYFSSHLNKLMQDRINSKTCAAKSWFQLDLMQGSLYLEQMKYWPI